MALSNQEVFDKMFAAAMEVPGYIVESWYSDITFAVDTIVTHNGVFYRCALANKGYVPGAVGSEAYWESAFISFTRPLVPPPGPPLPYIMEGIEFTQVVPAAVWNINHGLNRRITTVTLVNTLYEVITGAITFTDSNNLIIDFSGFALAGKAFIIG
jgi:hypothetical protein